MLITITERELASRGFSLADREEWFVAAHPAWKSRTKELLGVYLTCQSDRPVAGQIRFEEALTHVQKCGWCCGQLRLRTRAAGAKQKMHS